MKNSSFLIKLCIVFFMLAVAFGVAGWAAWKYWNMMFTVLGYGTADFSKLSIEMQALKIPLNLTMYAVPTTLGLTGVGFAAASFLCLLLDALDESWNRFLMWQLRRKEQRHA